ncbi:MAG: ABC transporter permease [Chloroflexi bacterium]|nr:MAG: ABC transporter permease [Chloroflexota bacterium]
MGDSPRVHRVQGPAARDADPVLRPVGRLRDRPPERALPRPRQRAPADRECRNLRATVVIGLAIVVVLFGLDLRQANLPLLGLCVVIISVTTAGLGLMFGSIGLVMRDAIIVANIVYYLLLIICGINFPVSRLPGALQVLAYSLPLTRGVQAARDAAAGATLGHVSGLLAGELLVGAAWALGGYFLFRGLENWSRRGGLQEAY